VQINCHENSNDLFEAKLNIIEESIRNYLEVGLLKEIFIQFKFIF